MAAWNTFRPGLALLSLVCVAVADDNNLWIYPTEPGPSNNFVANSVFTLGSKQTIQWTTTLESYYIALFQQQIDPASGIQIESIHTVDSDGGGDQSFKWTVQTYNANQTKSPIYFFWINPGSSTGFTSHYFNITTDDTTSATTSSAATRSSTISQSTASSTIPSSANNISTGTLVSPTSASTSTASDTSTSNSSDTSVLKVALGVSLGLGIPLVLFTGIWIGLKAVRQRRAASRNGDHPNEHDAAHSQPGGWQMALLPGREDQKSTPATEAPYFQNMAEASDSDAFQSPHGRAQEMPSDLPPPVELDTESHRRI